MKYGSPKVIHYTSVKAEDVANARGTRIRVLISKDDGAPTYAMRFFEMDPQGHIPEHKHPWEHEIFVIKGKLGVKIGGEYYEVDEGTAIYIPPNMPHEYWNIGREVVQFICTIPHKPTAEGKQ